MLTSAPVTFTSGAREEIRRLISQQGFDTNKYLRVGVKGGGCSGMSYVLEFDDKKDKDQVFEINDITCIISPSHIMYLLHMEIDFKGGLNSRGFTFNNPNASSTCGCGSSFGV